MDTLLDDRLKKYNRLVPFFAHKFMSKQRKLFLSNGIELDDLIQLGYETFLSVHGLHREDGCKFQTYLSISLHNLYVGLITNLCSRKRSISVKSTAQEKWEQYLAVDPFEELPGAEIGIFCIPFMEAAIRANAVGLSISELYNLAFTKKNPTVVPLVYLSDTADSESDQGSYMDIIPNPNDDTDKIFIKEEVEYLQTKLSALAGSILEVLAMPCYPDELRNIVVLRNIRQKKVASQNNSKYAARLNASMKDLATYFGVTPGEVSAALAELQTLAKKEYNVKE